MAGPWTPLVGDAARKKSDVIVSRYDVPFRPQREMGMELKKGHHPLRCSLVACELLAVNYQRIYLTNGGNLLLFFYRMKR